MRYSLILLVLQAVLALLAACSPSVPDNAREEQSQPHIFPDYTDVTIPANIAPLRFALDDREAAALCEIVVVDARPSRLHQARTPVVGSLRPKTASSSSMKTVGVSSWPHPADTKSALMSTNSAMVNG